MKIGADEFMKRIQKIRDLELKGKLSVMLKIEIKTGGAAYSEDDVLTTEGRYELQRNLMDICRQITNGCNEGYIMDINGNKVGNWSVE
nr:MAG TPA: hypothetical protein [Bacteriophage sp.]